MLLLLWDAPTSHSCLPREQNFCHVCSQHTGSGNCSLQLLLFQQNHRFYGANFIEDQMNPALPQISPQLSSLSAKKQEGTKDELLKTREEWQREKDSKEIKNSGKCCCSSDLQYRFKDLKRINSLIVLGSPCNKSPSPKTGNYWSNSG